MSDHNRINIGRHIILFVIKCLKLNGYVIFCMLTRISIHVLTYSETSGKSDNTGGRARGLVGT